MLQKVRAPLKSVQEAAKQPFLFLSLPIEIYIVSGVAVPVPAKLPIQLDHIEVIVWVKIKDISQNLKKTMRERKAGV